jgi:uncharacterized protein YbjT (DUF2867 family)
MTAARQRVKDTPVRLLAAARSRSLFQAAKVGHVAYISLQRREHPKVKLFEVTDVENDTERDIKASGIAYTIARNTLYSEAFTAFFGSDDLTTSGVHAFGPEGKATYAAMADLAEANTKLLTDPRHRNKSYDFNANKALSFREMVESSARPSANGSRSSRPRARRSSNDTSRRASHPKSRSTQRAS